jgi:hypothetical protein
MIDGPKVDTTIAGTGPPFLYCVMFFSPAFWLLLRSAALPLRLELPAPTPCRVSRLECLVVDIGDRLAVWIADLREPAGIIVGVRGWVGQSCNAFHASTGTHRQKNIREENRGTKASSPKNLFGAYRVYKQFGAVDELL